MSKPDFEVATLEEFDGMRLDRTGFARPSTLSPLQAYLGLKSLFGEPNREHIDEDKEQWVFRLRTDNARIEVNDWKLESWSIHIYEKNKDEGRSEYLIRELEKQVAHAAGKHRALISSLLKKPVGHVIENPFALYYNTAQELVAIAEQLRASHSDPSSAPKVGDWSTHYTMCRAAFFQLLAAIEGLLNLIYEVYLKPELREDRIVDRLSREQVDVKLRLAPIYCDCFGDSPIDHTTEAFRNFQRLVNSRNDFIHANVTKSMKTSVVYHDDITFLVHADSLLDAITPNSMSDVGIEEISRIKRAIDDIVAEVLARMKPRYRKEFGSVMHEDYISVEYEDGVPVIAL